MAAPKARVCRRTNERFLRRPFAPRVLDRARRRVQRYCLTLHRDPDVGYVGSSLELPTVFADGANAKKCVAETIDALVATVATMLEKKLHPPAPASTGKREQQINLRVSTREKAVLEDAARPDGFRSVSDSIRNAALEACSR
jgi:predicted RNase H-like HicB family nuclease